MWSRQITRMLSVTGLLLAWGLRAPMTALAQGVSAPTGGRTLVNLNVAGTQPGNLPPEIDLQTGALDVVDKNGRRMLRASSNTVFLLNLSERLTRDFLLELEFIPKKTSSSEDFNIEGTPDTDHGDNSASLMWFSSNVRAVGGGSYFDAPMPSSMYATLAGVLTQVTVSVQDRLIRVYTNGQLTHTIPNRRFVRNPFVRVFLGGEDDDQNAVYLTRMRVADMGSTTASIASALAPGGPGSASGGGAGPAGPGGGGPGSGSLRPNSSGTTSGNAPVQIALANLSVTDTPAGPVVNWLGVPSAVYMVQRWLVTDPTCCANTSPANPALTSPPWQDTPLPVSGTYVYSVTATTSSGSTSAQVQFSYQRTGTGQIVQPPNPGARPTATPMPATATTTTTTTTTATALPAASPTGTIGPMAAPAAPTPPPGVASNPTITASPATSSTSGRYRVTLTGFRVATATLEMPQSTDGRGDEVYAAAAAVVWDRSTSTVRSRTSVSTKEYGELVNAMLYPNRLLGGTMTPNGGIWTGNGVEQIPAQYDPAGSSIPAPTSDRFPILVWEGVLSDGKEALLVVPTLWERDIDPSLYTLWVNKWSSGALAQHMLSQPVTAAIGVPLLSYTPLAAPGLPIAVPIPDMTANVRDLPIGMVPNPPVAPVGADYVDRHVFITREKLGALQTAGASTILPISYSVQTSIFARGSYTLYLRIERL